MKDNFYKSVKGNMFMPKEQKSRNDVTHFSDCNKWVFKVPQGHLKTYGKLRFNLNSAGLVEHDEKGPEDMASPSLPHHWVRWHDTEHDLLEDCFRC